MTTPPAVEPVEDKKPTLNELVAGAKEQINQGSYSEALVSLQKAEQVIDEANLTKSLEKTYNVKTAPKQ
jgi:cytochrome c2